MVMWFFLCWTRYTFYIFEWTRIIGKCQEFVRKGLQECFYPRKTCGQK